MIVGNLSTGLVGDPLKTAWQVHQLQRTHPVLKSAINGYQSLTAHHAPLKKLKAVFNTSMKKVPADQMTPRMLLLMGPDQRREQVENCLKMTGKLQQSLMIRLI
ncbi:MULTISPECIES: hypothetical protein [Pseudomonas]|uniref:Uncharacterized protein n=1 Tax=Pseudomonas wuhanensis TaxID=2954098 RepID=A0ABY9GLK4_9PSED|nr:MULTISPECIES: hypothetical protein [unclassified Pseudomonas]WLI10752.1 hypothetical protein PSH65_21445 [Pseudomonas sp. FP603]WLI16571.1 hypothetical protein PSH88_20070 [Pseudomonas sp. FP607]